MKIYLFDTETGIYLGEDFADEGARPGEYLLPEGATTIAPPLAPNGIPKFDQLRQRWDILPLSGPQAPGLRGRLEGNAAGDNSL